MGNLLKAFLYVMLFLTLAPVLIPFYMVLIIIKSAF